MKEYVNGYVTTQGIRARAESFRARRNVAENTKRIAVSPGGAVEYRLADVKDRGSIENPGGVNAFRADMAIDRTIEDAYAKHGDAGLDVYGPWAGETQPLATVTHIPAPEKKRRWIIPLPIPIPLGRLGLLAIPPLVAAALCGGDTKTVYVDRPAVAPIPAACSTPEAVDFPKGRMVNPPNIVFPPMEPVLTPTPVGDPIPQGLPVTGSGGDWGRRENVKQGIKQ